MYRVRARWGDVGGRRIERVVREGDREQTLRETKR